MDLLSHYLNKLTKLRVDRTKGAAAPHKAVLLISVFQLMDVGYFNDNRIYITPELVAKFKDNWCALVHSDKFRPNFSLPFFHLKNDGFWQLITLPGRALLLTSSQSINSFGALKNVVEYARFCDDFFKLAEVRSNREKFEQVLLATFLGGNAQTYEQYDLIGAMASQMLYESPETYRKVVNTNDEEEIFVRGGVFKKVIPKIYNYTCCITGMQIITTRDVQMIDACHIVPFAESHDDTVSNGISLSPNLHRAFDRFLVTIDDDYRVIVSDQIMETGQYRLKDLHGRKIHLPEERQFFPAPENLAWHVQKFRLMAR